MNFEASKQYLLDQIALIKQDLERVEACVVNSLNFTDLARTLVQNSPTKLTAMQGVRLYFEKSEDAIIRDELVAVYVISSLGFKCDPICVVHSLTALLSTLNRTNHIKKIGSNSWIKM